MGSFIVWMPGVQRKSGDLRLNIKSAGRQPFIKIPFTAVAADGTLYCLDYHNGRLRWKFYTNGAITGTPVIHNDVVYFGSHDHMLYAVLA